MTPRAPGCQANSAEPLDPVLQGVPFLRSLRRAPSNSPLCQGLHPPPHTHTGVHMGAGDPPEQTRGREHPGGTGSAARAPRVGAPRGPAASPATPRSAAGVNSPPCAVPGQALPGDQRRVSQRTGGVTDRKTAPAPAWLGGAASCVPAVETAWLRAALLCRGKKRQERRREPRREGRKRGRRANVLGGAQPLRAVSAGANDLLTGLWCGPGCVCAHARTCV